MKKETDQIYTGNVQDCMVEGFSIVHACKHPCHARVCGAAVPKDSPKYLGYATGRHLYLNMIDPEKPMFCLELFEKFFAWAIPRIQSGEKLLIHCNQGQSRSRSLALLLMSRLGILGPAARESYERAAWRFEEQTEEKYFPGAGISQFLRENWTLLMDVQEEKVGHHSDFSQKSTP